MIYINARFLTQPVTGVQRFAIEISKYLKMKLGKQVQFISPHNIVYPELSELLDNKIIGKRTGHLWEQIDLPNYLKRDGKLLLLNLSNTGPIFYDNQIVTHHDIAYVRFPQSFSFSFRMLYRFIVPKMLRKSKCLITVSEFSKNEIRTYYNYPLDKIYVVNNAVNKTFKKEDPEILLNSRTKPYLLAVSSSAYHKNFKRMIDAFSRLSENKDVQLIIVGAQSNKSFTSIEKSNNENVIFLGRVSDSELISLYANAIAFVFPSIYEGFGIPPLEAQSCGCPVIASNQSSIPEVLGNSVLYFDPYNVDSIIDCMSRVINDRFSREQLITLGHENALNYSWEESAMNVIQIINKYGTN